MISKLQNKVKEKDLVVAKKYLQGYTGTTAESKRQKSTSYSDHEEIGEAPCVVKIRVKGHLIDLKNLVNICNDHCDECPEFYYAVKEASCPPQKKVN